MKNVTIKKTRMKRNKTLTKYENEKRNNETSE